MTAKKTTKSALIDFATEFYEQPGVADRLLTWQQEGELDICLVLFAIWLTLEQKTAEKQLQQHPLISHCHEFYLQPLRNLRYQMCNLSKQEPCFEEFYQQMKAMELKLEQVYLSELQKLSETLAVASGDMSPELPRNLRSLGILISTSQVHWLEQMITSWQKQKPGL